MGETTLHAFLQQPGSSILNTNIDLIDLYKISANEVSAQRSLSLSAGPHLAEGSLLTSCQACSQQKQKQHEPLLTRTSGPFPGLGTSFPWPGKQFPGVELVLPLSPGPRGTCQKSAGSQQASMLSSQSYLASEYRLV